MAADSSNSGKEKPGAESAFVMATKNNNNSVSLYMVCFSLVVNYKTGIAGRSSCAIATLEHPARLPVQ